MKIKAKKRSKCGKIKALYDFYKNPSHSDGAALIAKELAREQK